jgi:hypothetical protein
MSDLPRRSISDRLRAAIAALAERLEPQRRDRLAPARAWLLLADGRPALGVRPRR